MKIQLFRIKNLFVKYNINVDYIMKWAGVLILINSCHSQKTVTERELLFWGLQRSFIEKLICFLWGNGWKNPFYCVNQQNLPVHPLKLLKWVNFGRAQSVLVVDVLSFLQLKMQKIDVKIKTLNLPMVVNEFHKF